MSPITLLLLLLVLQTFSALWMFVLLFNERCHKVQTKSGLLETYLGLKELEDGEGQMQVWESSASRKNLNAFSSYWQRLSNRVKTLTLCREHFIAFHSGPSDLKFRGNYTY